MYILFLLLITFKSYISSNINFVEDIILSSLKDTGTPRQESIKSAIKTYLMTYNNFNYDTDSGIFNKCTDKLFEKTNGIENYLHLLSYSGKELSDLGQESSCIRNGFSYYLLSYNYNLNSKNHPFKIFQFLENNNFYTGLCLFKECNELVTKIFNIDNYNRINDEIYNTKIQQIINEENIPEEEKKNIDCDYSPELCKYEPYYTLNLSGIFDENLTEKEKSKYKTFLSFFIITIFLVCFQIFISLFIYCGYYLFNTKNLANELIEESDLDDDDDENSDEEPNEQILYNNSTSSKDKKDETLFKAIIRILYKYFSFITNIIILTMRKSRFFNNKNMEVITKLRFLVLLLISFSTNFDVYIKIPSKGFANDFLYKEIYFIFLKYASFGLDMYICLDGFEVMYKLMNYFKKNFFDKGNKTITILGLLKFYLYSCYKILAYILLFFIVNYFNRYYIYIHNGGTIYSYYSNNIINNKNIFQIFNPKNSILSYFFPSDDEFLFNSKMSLLFINEFYAFTLFLIIFYIGNILKSKIYDYAIFIYIFISYFLSYLFCSIKDAHNNIEEDFYTYNKVIRNLSLIKYPHILFNHYLLGTFTGLICFYLKDGLSNNSMINDPDKCPFNFCCNILEIFDYLVQKGRKICIAISLIIQLLLCMTFTILINKKNYNQKNSNDEIISLNFDDVSLKIIYYYESGAFIFTFCFITILLFEKEIEEKNYEIYNLFNLINQINFSYVNTVYLMTFSYYCFFIFQLKLTYQNLWLITFGLFIFFSFENLIFTIIFIMPIKMIFKIILDKIIVFNSNSLSKDNKFKNDEIKINNSGLSNIENNDEDDDLDDDKNEIPE